MYVSFWNMCVSFVGSLRPCSCQKWRRFVHRNLMQDKQWEAQTMRPTWKRFPCESCNYWLPGMDPKQSYLWMRRLFFCIIVCQIFIVTWVHSWFIFCRLIENSMIKIRISHVDQFTNTLIAIRSIVSDFQWFGFFLALSRSNISQTFSFCKYLPWPGA